MKKYKVDHLSQSYPVGSIAIAQGNEYLKLISIEKNPESPSHWVGILKLTSNQDEETKSPTIRLAHYLSEIESIS
jgi:hypothetical protein